ncbi:MAG: NAD(P)/FAD-dependent oxidoreductase [Rhodoferax sp.]|nr:NAD(P)/FAD-dependent oxidoreductase [Rhodoferax sp.]
MATEIVDVLIVGAGVSGIGMACTLERDCPGLRYAVLERRQNVGGTWDLFRYPGVRSDSDMFTYGYQFRPWRDFKVLAEGNTIRDYLADTAREYGVDKKIRFGVKTVRADWSGADQRWTVTAHDEADPTRQRIFVCRHIVMSTGYYNHDNGHTPAFPGMENFKGQIIHPQHWPQDFDSTGKHIVVVGSGATAITLIPAMAPTAAHVTMLQRSPTYIMSVPSRDGMTESLSRILPRNWAFAIARRRNTAIAGWVYQACRKWPEKARAFLLKKTAERLDGKCDISHFTPSYMPWDQRVCVVPDEDLFAAIRSGKASVATDRISGFGAGEVQLASGAAIKADVLVSATGLELQAVGGIQIHVDGVPYKISEHMLYKGVLLQDLPNFAWIIGYTNASWTLKADLSTSYLARLYKHMDAKGMSVVVARDRENCKVDQSVMGGLRSGYVVRANDRMPRQGSRAPWQSSSHYPSDKITMLQDPVDDGIITFEARATSRDPGLQPS